MEYKIKNLPITGKGIISLEKRVPNRLPAISAGTYSYSQY
jgi:hypothetical protein